MMERFKNPLVVVCLVAVVVLVVLVGASPKPLFYDEPHYVNTAGYVEDLGVGKVFMEEHPGYAGPLFGIVHFLLRPVTGLELPWVRYVNVVFWAGMLVVMAGVFRRMGRSGSLGMMLAAVPPLWPMAGMALTEMAAMFFLSLSLFAVAPLLAGRQVPGGRRAGMIQALLGGVLLGVAIYGRQTFLPILILPMVALFLQPGRRLVWGIYLVAALPLPLWLMWSWQGLSPPMMQAAMELINMRSEKRPDFLLMSYGYAFLFSVFVAPGYLRVRSWLLVPMGVVALGLAWLGIFKPFLPGKTLFAKVFPESILPTASMVAPVLFAVLGIWFVLSVSYRSLFSERWRQVIPIALAVGAVLGTPLFISHVFSSRYPAVVAPLLLVLLAPSWSLNRGALYRLVGGVLFGMFLLVSWLYIGGHGYNHVGWTHCYFPHLFPDPEAREWDDDGWREMWEEMQGERRRKP